MAKMAQPPSHPSHPSPPAPPFTSSTHTPSPTLGSGTSGLPAAPPASSSSGQLFLQQDPLAPGANFTSFRDQALNGSASHVVYRSPAAGRCGPFTRAGSFGDAEYVPMLHSSALDAAGQCGRSKAPIWRANARILAEG